MAEENEQKESKRQGSLQDSDLIALIKAHEDASLGSSVATGGTVSSVIGPSAEEMSTLEIHRFDALNAFWARPLGNEVENRSQVVIPELRDTIQWIMPQLMRIFVASPEIFRFDPEGANDTGQAQLETQAVNHVMMKENPGFLILHDFFWDAMLLHNGYVEVYYDKQKQTSVERYSQLTEIEVADLLQEKPDEELEVLEQHEYEVTLGDPMGQSFQVPVFDLKVRRTATVGKVCIEALPPEEMRVSPRTRGSVENSQFTSHVAQKTRSELIAEGYDRDLIESLPSDPPSWMEMDALARNQNVDQMSMGETQTPADRAMQEIERHHVIMNVDWDDDGIAELRRIVFAGEKILTNEEIEETPFVSGHAIRMPHRHTGISLYDLLMDLQVLKSILWRMGIDNLALANQTRIGADWQAVNIDDLMTVRPGGVIRTKGPPNQSLFPIVQPSNLTEQVLPALDTCDSMREMRTGVGRSSMGLDADELQNVTKGGQLAAMSAASLKVELVARLLAEGVVDIAKKIQSTLQRHHDKPLEFQLAGKFVQSDPTSWRKRTRVSARVGLGSGNREEARANGMMLGQAQGALKEFGLVGPRQAWNSFRDFVSVLGYENPEKYAMDPDSDEYKQFQASRPQPPPDPRIASAQIRAQSVQQQEQAQTQRALLDARVDLVKAQTQRTHEQTLTVQQQLHDAYQAQLDRQHEHQQNQHGHGMEAAQTADDMRERRFEALLRAFAQIAAAEISAKTALQTAQMGQVASEADSDAA